MNSSWRAWPHPGLIGLLEQALLNFAQSYLQFLDGSVFDGLVGKGHSALALGQSALQGADLFFGVCHRYFFQDGTFGLSTVVSVSKPTCLVQTACLAYLGFPAYRRSQLLRITRRAEILVGAGPEFLAPCDGLEKSGTATANAA